MYSCCGQRLYKDVHPVGVLAHFPCREQAGMRVFFEQAGMGHAGPTFLLAAKQRASRSASSTKTISRLDFGSSSARSCQPFGDQVCCLLGHGGRTKYSKPAGTINIFQKPIIFIRINAACNRGATYTGSSAWCSCGRGWCFHLCRLAYILVRLSAACTGCLLTDTVNRWMAPWEPTD